jgi:hypothetical protein
MVAVLIVAETLVGYLLAGDEYRAAPPGDESAVGR